MRYFFHLRSDEGFEEDEEGMEFSTLEEAESEARKAAREMVAEIVLRGGLVDGRAFEISDVSHAVLKVVRFRDLIGID